MSTPRESYVEEAGPAPGLDGSLAVHFPHMRLAAAGLVAAIKDLKASNPLVGLDAFHWLMTDGDTWLDAVGVQGNSDQLFRRLMRLPRKRNDYKFFRFVDS